MPRVLRAWAISLLVGGLGVGCGSGVNEPLPARLNGGMTPPPQAVGELNVGSGGLNPARIVLTAGAELTLVNLNTISHQMASGPHPEHTDCPELNAPTLRPGERFTVVLGSTSRECSLHDHLNPNNRRYHGAVVIEPSAQ